VHLGYLSERFLIHLGYLSEKNIYKNSSHNQEKGSHNQAVKLFGITNK